jgi:HTH-type transcriptional regulator/antitoxin HigA
MFPFMGNDVRPIRTKADYAAAREAMYGLTGDDREVMEALLDAYERKRLALGDANSALKAFMALRGLGQKDLADALGSVSRASEILHGKRAMTVPQLRALHKAWKMPTDPIIAAAQA